MRSWLLLLFPLTLLRAQENIHYSLSNYLRYGNGDERVGLVTQHRDYFENLTDAKLSISDFLIGFRLLHDAPPEFGVEFSGLRKRYVEFRKDDLYIRAGDSYTLYGRGFALNLFESRPLGFDTGLDGVKFEYTTNKLRAGITAGDIQYHDILDLNRTEEYRIRAGMVEFQPIETVSLGVAFSSGKSKFPPPSYPEQPAQFDIPEYFGKMSWSGFDVSFSYAEKRTTVYGVVAPTHRGTAFYGAASYAGQSFGVTVEYKDYRFGIADPYERNNRNRAFKALAFQNGPIVHKEHTFTLLSRYPHIIDFNDEVGLQVDLFATLFGNLSGAINFAASSRHYSFAPTGDTVLFLPVYGSKPRTTSWLPNFDRRYSPFWEVYVEMQYYFREDATDYALIGFNRRSEDTAEELRTPAHPHGLIESRRSTGIPFALQYTVAGEWAFKFVSERQWVYDDTNPAQQKFYNHLVSLSVTKTPRYAITLRYEFTSDRGTIDGRRNWTALDASYRISNSHTVTITIGGDRGGQICSNGVCRIVNPFLGFRGTIISYL